MGIRASSPDVIGFGALNLDYIASATKLSAKRAERVAEWAARFEWNVETPVDKATIDRAINQLGAMSLDASLGGSAWNTIFALAQMRLNLRLGYVGVAGRVDYPGLSFLRQMDAGGIDRRFVWTNAHGSSGLCLSYIEDGERMMLTHPGANLEMSRLIRENFEDLAEYLASSRYVHITSFLDSRTPVELLRVLRRTRELNAHTKITIDLGHNWAFEPTEAVRGLLGLADYLFLNGQEFKALGRYSPGEPDIAVANRILGQCAPACGVVVTKRYDCIDLFRRASGRVVNHRFAQSWAASEAEIEDTTGAGDAFAAGLIAALASPRLQVELGAYLGQSLSRHKMRHRAFEGHADFPSLAKGFLQIAEQPNHELTRPAGVFIAHGADPQWETVRQFLEQECRLPVYALSPDVRSDHLAQAIREHLDRCSFGVCLLTADDVGGGEIARADQSVVHQAGILQGMYGFRRVAILVEAGCQTFSNVAGLIRLDFPTGHVDSTFWQLERMLRREGLVRAT
jgi:sugar/nucleoside kinase (ribokinase family)